MATEYSEDVGYTLDGDQITLHVTRSDRFTTVTGSYTIGAGLAGLWASDAERAGRPELARAIWAAKAEWAATPEGRASIVVADPVWGIDARAGQCEGCGAECGNGERHYYTFPKTGTVGLCLDCGPEENYAGLAEGVARCEACGADVSWADCSYGHEDCYQTECDTPLGCGHVSRDCEDMAEGVAA